MLHKAHLPYLILFPIAVLFVFVTLLLPMKSAEQIEPGSSVHGFPYKYLMDYSLYIYDIKSGQEGRLLWTNAFSEEYYPPYILQPHYPIMGMLSIPFKINPFQVYMLAKLIMYAALLAGVYLLIDRVINNQSTKILSFVLFLSATSIWQIDMVNGIPRNTDPTTYSNWFNIFLKLTMIPPHHLIAVLLLITIIMRISIFTSNKRSYAITALLGFVLGFIHPYVANTMLFMIMTQISLQTLIKRKFDWFMIMHVFVVGLFTFPVISYHGWHLVTIMKEEAHILGTVVAVKPIVDAISYIKALGPLFFLGLFPLFSITFWKSPILRMFAIWAYLPIILFYLPLILPIPTGQLRLFQVYQHIPLAVLSAWGIERLTRLIKAPEYFLVSIVIVASIVYAIPPYILEYQYHTSPYQPYFYLAKLYRLGEPMFQFLNDNTQPQSVVMASEHVSRMIPGKTHNHVILGHNNRRLEEKKAEIEKFFQGQIPLKDLSDFFTRYKTSYVIFGLDNTPYYQLPYSKSPVLKPIYEQNGITITKVIL